MLDKLLEIEKNINIKKFIIKDENIWPIFRNIIGSKLSVLQNNQEGIQPNKGKIEKIEKILNYLRYIPKDIIKLLTKYDYIILTTSDDYKNINNKNINRLTDTIFENMQNIKILNIMKIFQNKRIQSQESINEAIVMYTSMQILVKFVSLFIRFKQNSASISEELKKNGVEMGPKEVHTRLRDYMALIYIYKILFKITKPKAVITTCYTNYQIIKVANSLGIPTIEFQHGNIINHFAYSVNSDFNNNFYPKYLLVFGTRDKNYLKDKFYIQDSNNIYCVGNMMVDYYKSKNNFEIKNLKNDYECIISISLQWTIANETITYVVKQAKKYKNICFILIPRDESDLTSYKEDVENIKVLNRINCYEIVSNSDYHMTSYSSCAIESLSLGTCNIFLNINKLSKQYFNDFIENNIFNFIINSSENIADIVPLSKAYNKREVINSNTEYIKSNYKKNIKKFYQNILEKKK